MSDNALGGVDDFDDRRNMHSFIVRVWLERSSSEKDQEIWRGHIIHLPSFERRYFSDIDDITSFISSYLNGQS